MNYFAYGSNMSTRILGQWCADFRVIGPARLVDYRLAFTRPSKRWGGGAADVVAESGQIVWGVLYTIEDDCLLALDRKEGLGQAYQRLDCVVSPAAGSLRPAMTYTVIDKAKPELSPAPAYKAALVEGAVEHHLPGDYLAFLRAIPTATHKPE